MEATNSRRLCHIGHVNRMSQQDLDDAAIRLEEIGRETANREDCLRTPRSAMIYASASEYVAELILMEHQ